MIHELHVTRDMPVTRGTKINQCCDSGTAALSRLTSSVSRPQLVGDGVACLTAKGLVVGVASPCPCEAPKTSLPSCTERSSSFSKRSTSSSDSHPRLGAGVHCLLNRSMRVPDFVRIIPEVELCVTDES